MLPLGAGISGTRRKCRNLIYSQQWLTASQEGISPSTNGPLVWKGIHRVPPFPMYVLGMGVLTLWLMVTMRKAKVSGTESCSPRSIHKSFPLPIVSGNHPSAFGLYESTNAGQVNKCSHTVCGHSWLDFFFNLVKCFQSHLYGFSNSHNSFGLWSSNWRGGPWGEEGSSDADSQHAVCRGTACGQ